MLPMIKREVKACPVWGGFILLHSVAGGTGSGVGKLSILTECSNSFLGTYITERLRAEYPHAFILNQLVWPYTKGEVTVQHYNTVLTLSKLYPVCMNALTIMLIRLGD